MVDAAPERIDCWQAWQFELVTRDKWEPALTIDEVYGFLKDKCEQLVVCAAKEYHNVGAPPSTRFHICALRQKLATDTDDLSMLMETMFGDFADIQEVHLTIRWNIESIVCGWKAVVRSTSRKDLDAMTKNVAEEDFSWINRLWLKVLRDEASDLLPDDPLLVELDSGHNHQVMPTHKALCVRYNQLKERGKLPGHLLPRPT